MVFKSPHAFFMACTSRIETLIWRTTWVEAHFYSIVCTTCNVQFWWRNKDKWISIIISSTAVTNLFREDSCFLFHPRISCFHSIWALFYCNNTRRNSYFGWRISQQKWIVTLFIREFALREKSQLNQYQSTELKILQKPFKANRLL